jgi:catechol 2,3-dioxygenase-like lactoylglutathione lyase family enzyme
MAQLYAAGLDHIGLKVTDMDRSVSFYRDVLGLELLHTSGPHDNGGRSATLRAGGQKLDLFYRPDFVSANREKPVGMDHVCLTFELEAVEPLLDHLKQHAVEIMWGPVTRGSSTSVYVYDPDGIHVELRVPVASATAERPSVPAAARPA